MLKSLYSIFRFKPNPQTENNTNVCTECHDTKAENGALKKENQELRENIEKLRLQLRIDHRNIFVKERCEICLTILPQKEISQHLCLNEMKLIKCCSMPFKSTRDFTSHLRETIHTDVKFYKCDKCTMGFPSAVLLKFHRLIHKETTSESELNKLPAVRSNLMINRMEFSFDTSLLSQRWTNIEATHVQGPVEVSNTSRSHYV